MNDLSFRREPSLRIPGFTELARGEPCMFRVEDVCNGDWATTVWCHSNMSRHGRGKDYPAHDPYGALGCSACHYWYDHGNTASRAEKEEVFVRAMEKSHLHFWRVGKFLVNRKAKA